MISLLSDGDIPDFTIAAGFYRLAGVHIATELALYGSASPRALFWIGRGGAASPYCALCRADGRFYISADAQREECHAELSAFLRCAGGFSALEAPPAVCHALRDMGVVTVGRVMRHSGEIPDSELDITVQIPSVQESYALVCEAESWLSRDPRWSPWYVHLTRLIRERRGFLRGVYADGKLVSGGGVYASDGRDALISGLCTLPDYRGRGFAGAVVRGLCRESVCAGMSPFLACKPGLERFYERLGFQETGEWATLTIFDH